MTQQAIAEKVGISRQAVAKAAQPKKGNTEKVASPKPKRQNIYLHEQPERAATQIIAKYGARYGLFPMFPK